MSALKAGNELLRRARIIIPTFNAQSYAENLISALKMQGIMADQVLIIDSSSSDETVSLFSAYGAQVKVIPKAEFNHGGTRRLAADMSSSYDYLIYLTQDAVPADASACGMILTAFQDPLVGMAYGRQLPRRGARGVERHARLMNYPEGASEVRSLADKRRLGIKSTFSSNSFAAYRRKALEAVGGFPRDSFFGEDQVTAGRMLLNGWRLAYVSEAQVVHSHGYTMLQDFKRYFDVGVFHAHNKWMLKEFGAAEGEGGRFIKSEIIYLMRNGVSEIPEAMLRTISKYLGYRIGRMERHIPISIKMRLSMNSFYWQMRRNE